MATLSISVCVSSASATSPAASDRYDHLIVQAVKRYWGDYPRPAAWWAQLYQESRMNPDARSPVGAEGLAQFMPATWNDVVKQLGWGNVSRRDARLAIEAGAFYQAQQRNRWSKSPNRSATDRNEFGQAGYNAGYGHIAKAQTACGGGPTKPLVWAQVQPCLVQITGRHSAETTSYVVQIRKWIAMKEARGFMS